MKYENLMDIPLGYEMQLAEDYADYPRGTKILRSNLNTRFRDAVGVSFIFPDGEWDYLNKEQIEDIPKEKKGMKGSDKVMVELTGYQVATIYALIGRTSIGDKNESYDLYEKLEELLDVSDAIPVGYNFPDRIAFEEFEEELYKAALEPEAPVLTEAQKKALELKETIAQAQKQLEELEKNL